MKSIDAKNIVKTLNWIIQSRESDDLVLSPIFNKEKNMYECFIKLPLIESTVIGIGESKIESIDNATKQAADLIDRFLEKNSTIVPINYFGGDRYVLEESDQDRLLLNISSKK